MVKSLFLLVFFLGLVCSQAQVPIHYTTKQGLPTNHVYDMAEDVNGFIWFATKQGLVKYDGETFKTFTIKDGLPNNDTWLLEPDLQGRLWYFTKSAYQGYIKYDSIYKFAEKNKKVITPRFVYKTNDSLWFYGTSGLQTFSKTHIINSGPYNIEELPYFSAKTFAIQEQYGANLGKTMPFFINPETKEYIFINQNQLLIYDWDLQLKKEIPIHIPQAYNLNKIQNQGLLYNQMGYFAMAKGVLFIDFKNYTTAYRSFKEMVGVDEVKYFRCRGLKEEIQVSIPGHLMVFDYNLKLKNTYTFPEELSQSSYKDRNGNVWLTDLANGVSLLPNSQLQTQQYLQNQKVQKINSIQDNFYAGINDDGFYKLDKNTNTFKLLNQFNRANAEVYQIKEDAVSNQNYFITANKTYSLKTSKLGKLKIKTLKEYGSNNSFLVGIKDIIYYKGYNYFVTSSYLIKNKNPLEPSLNIAAKSGLLFAEVYKNQLYIAGSDGLYQVINDSLVRPKLKNELLDIPISSIASTNDFLLVGTDGRGVYLYAESELFHLKETDGLSVQRIIQDDNDLWLATQKGVKKIELNQENLTDSKIVDAFYGTDGLLQNNTNDIFIDDHYLYAASDMGLAKLDVNNLVYKQLPKLYFKTQNDTLFYKNGARDHVTITFALQDYVNQEHITYKYRLLPTQKEWITSGTKTLNFSNLAPKLYTLEVTATDQHYNKSISRQYLNIIPGWYQNIYSKIGFALVVLFSFLFFVTKLKHRILKKEQAKAQQEKRVAGLELQALRSQMNPHFVHNSLNAILYFIQRNEVELSENYLSKFSKLIRLFFEYSRRQNITIKEELNLLNNYLEIEKLRFEEKLQYQINVCDKIDEEDQLIPSMLLQPILENAINHGLFHKKENGKVTIDLKQIKENTFQVTVKDNGIGINKAKDLFKVSSKNYQSNSSAVLHERLDLLNKSNEWLIVYTIKDLSEIDIKTTGTLVTLIFTQKYSN